LSDFVVLFCSSFLAHFSCLIFPPCVRFYNTMLVFCQFLAGRAMCGSVVIAHR
jgi:hypothetical protein